MVVKLARPVGAAPYDGCEASKISLTRMPEPSKFFDAGYVPNLPRV